MPETLKSLGQVAPAAAVDAALYTCPAATSAVISSIVVCNTGASPTTVRIHFRDEGAAAAVGNALVYGLDIAASETVALTLGITCDAADVIGVRSLAGGVTFTAFGTEIT